MSTVSKIPPAKHGQILKNPGFSGKTKPIVKIASIKVSIKKTGGKGNKRNTTTTKKSNVSRKTKKNKTKRRRTRKAESHYMQ